MSDPRCPYCGGEMRYAFNGDKVGVHFLICESCLSRSPVVSFNDDPYAAAMRRDGAKGEWIEEPVSGWPHCSECGCRALFNDIYETPIRSNFCPNCGAEMREEANDDD